MNTEKIIKIVGQIQNGLDEIKKELGVSNTLTEEIKKNKPKLSGKKKNKAEDLKVPIQKLFDSGFFKEVKIDMDVSSELQKKLLTKQKPLRSSVVNVLRDMVRKGLLERVDVVRGKRTLIGYKNKS